MKKILFAISAIFLAVSFYSCLEDPDVTPGIVGAGVPVFEENSAEKGKTANSITAYAKVVAENGSKIKARGFYYGTSPSPKKENGGKIAPDTVGIGVGEYTVVISGLDNDKIYYIIPYAENEIGIAYGTEFSVSTTPGLGSVENVKPDGIYASSAIVGVKINSEGEGRIERKGYYLYTSKTDSVAIDIDGVSAENNIYRDTLTMLKPSTKYYVRAFAENEYGKFAAAKIDSFTTRSGELKFGDTYHVSGFTDVTLRSSVNNDNDKTVTIEEYGFCWSENSGPTILDDTIHSRDGISRFEEIISGLKAHQPYYARAYARNNFDSVYYGKEVFFSTKNDIPTVSTLEVDESRDVKDGKANVGGSVADPGMSEVTSVGICWSTTKSVPDLSDSVLSMPLSNNFSGQITMLKGGTKYYVRAYAQNNIGIAYGEVSQFTTPEIFNENLAPFTGGERITSSTAYFAIDDNLYLLGGDIGAEYTNDLWMYSVSKNKWESRKPFSGGKAKWQTVVSFGVRAYVYGGYDDSGNEISGLYYYESGNENDWNLITTKPDSMTLCRSAGYSYSNSIFFVGGVSGDTVRSDVWAFQPGTKAWQKKTDFPVEQYGGIAVVIDDIAYVGMGKDTLDVCNGKIWTTADGGGTWDTNPIQCTIYNGSILAGVALNKSIYLIDEDHYILEYDTQTEQWTKKSQLPVGSREIHCMYAVNNKIYIGLGSDNALVVYDPVWDP